MAQPVAGWHPRCKVRYPNRGCDLGRRSRAAWSSSGASVVSKLPLAILLDQIVCQDLIAANVKVHVSPYEQVFHKIRIVFLGAKERREMIEKLFALSGAPVAPNLRLPRILAVVKKLLRPWIDADR